MIASMARLVLLALVLAMAEVRLELVDMRARTMQMTMKKNDFTYFRSLLMAVASCALSYSDNHLKWPTHCDY